MQFVESHRRDLYSYIILNKCIDNAKKKTINNYFLKYVLVHHFDSPNTINIYDIFIYNIWYALDSWVHSESQYICIYVRNM